ncbi:MFS transporter [Streptomyces sp. NPDC052301]|uniref:MFS transporter n=1 Tax=Streptomyces sp. NPDC052301 TaxID=3365687 RepID=UPI0037CD9AA3
MPSTTAPRTARTWALSGLVILTVNLRAAITGISPVLDDLQHAVHLTDTAVSVLTTLPVLCLGAFAALAPVIARRVGTESAITGALLLITAGVALRLFPSPACLFTGTALAGAGIAIGNVLLPAVIKQHFAHRVGAFTGLAMTLTACSGAVAAGLAVPLDHAAGWRVALAVWSLPAAAGAALWATLAVRQRTRSGGPPAGRHTAHGGSGAPPESLLRSPLAWSVAVFLGAVSLMFYALVAWLPGIMRSHGVSQATAGAMVSVLLTIGIPLGFAVPVVAARLPNQQPLILAVTVVKVIGLVGILTAPSAGWLWVCILGLATGSAFPLAMTVLALRSPDPAVAARLSGMAQTVGYLLAGVGPGLLGLLHALTGTWQIPLLLLLALVVPETAAGLISSRPGFVPAPAPAAPQPVHEKAAVG